MATILNFTTTEYAFRCDDDDKRDDRSTCEIILFPGVRYERWEDATPPAPQPAAQALKSRKKRDCLVIPD